jgi:predicted ester cyclase
MMRSPNTSTSLSERFRISETKSRNVISKGEKASARLKYRGTHRGELFGIVPTGKLARYAGAAVFTFRGD